MDRFEKRSLALALALILIFFGLVLYASRGLGIEVPTCLPQATLFDKGELVQLGEGRYQLNLVARMWTFEPAQIEIPRGATVDLYLTSADVVHGLHITHTNANLMAIPGAVGYTRLRLDKPGEYKIVCHEYCGTGHQTMAGYIVVK
jgi:cytochrome c oxidase subunit 2